MRTRPSAADVPLLAIAVGALVVRVLYTVHLGQDVYLGLTDARFYSASAIALADGNGYIDVLRSIDLGVFAPTAHHPPGWPALLAVFSLLGVDSDLGQRLVGCLVGAVVVVVVGLVARRIAGRTVGLLAAGLAAVHPTLIAADGSLMSESLSGLLALASVLAALRVLDRPTAARALVLGLAIGAGALVRGEALAFLVFLVAPLAVWAARSCAGGRRDAARVGGLALLGMAVVVAPWTVRNLVQLDGLVVISTNESTVLAGANCDGAFYGPLTGSWQFDCVPSEPGVVSEVDQAAIWRRQGIDYIGAHLDRVPVVVAARVGRTMGFWGGRHPLEEGRDEHVQALGNRVWLGFLLPVGTIGAVVVARRRPRVELAVLLAPVATALLVTVVGFGKVRFRHSMELVAVVLVAVALEALARRRRERDR